MAKSLRNLPERTERAYPGYRGNRSSNKHKNQQTRHAFVREVGKTRTSFCAKLDKDDER